MKYLSENLSPEEAKRKYRTLAKTMHPDVGGDEEEFKILADEYAAIVRLSEAPKYPSMAELQAQAATLVNKLVELLSELYPRTKVVLHYYPGNVDAEFLGNTTLPRMVEIAQIIRKFLPSYRVTTYFYREGRKSPFTLELNGTVAYIGVQRGTEVGTLECTYKGRRYNLFANRKYEMCTDGKMDRTYIMRKSPKFPLRSLVGF